MKRLFALLSIVILAWLPLTACMAVDAQARAIQALAEMDAEDYFHAPAQVALAEAAGQGNIPRMRKALESGADVNAVGQDGMTPLMWAAAIKHNLDGFRFLLKHGANPNMVTELPKDFAAERAHIIETAFRLEDPRYMKLLLEHGADPNTIINAHQNETPLFLQPQDRSLAQIKLLVEYGANVNHRAIYNTTPLLDVVSGDEYETALFLLRAGADPTIANSGNGNTAMKFVRTWRDRTEYHAQFPYYDDFIKALKERGYLDKNFQSANGT